MKSYVTGLLVSAAASALAFVFVLLFINPHTSGALGPALLLISLYIVITSLVTLLGFVVRVWKSGNEIIYAHLGTSFRQGLLISLVLVGSLVLQLYRIYNIWSGLIFVVAVILIELAFQSQTSAASKSQSKNRKKRRPMTDVVPKNNQGPWSIKIEKK